MVRPSKTSTLCALMAFLERKHTMFRPTIINLLIALSLLFSSISNVYAQNVEQLLKQLSGTTETPQRNAEQLTEAYQRTLDYLVPLLSSKDVRSRYDYQTILENICSYSTRPGAETERQTLSKTICNILEKKEMPDTVRHLFVLQLERIGKDESIPLLSKLLSSEDKHLRDYARRALEKNPDPGATDALLSGLINAKEPDREIGLINSLGQRKAEAAVKPMAKYLNNPNIKIATATVTALSNINGEDSTKTLLDFINNNPTSPIYNKAAQGLVDIAQNMVTNKNTEGAGKIYEALHESTTKTANESNNLFNIRAAAINGLVICNPEKGTRELVNIMKNGDIKTRTLAVNAARLSPTQEPVRALGKILPELGSDSQLQILILIGDRPDISLIDPVKELLNSKEESIRLAAINTLSKINNSAVVESLFEIAANGKEPEQTAAFNGLATMTGDDIEETIKTKASSGDTKNRVVAIGLLGQRHISGATKSLLDYTSDENENISAAAFEALAYVGDSVDIKTLIGLLSDKKEGKARNSGINCLKSILSRTKDKDAAAETIITKMKTAEKDFKLSLLSTLSAVGSPEALKTVVEATQSNDEATRDAGIRTLSDWPDYEAAKTLFDIASNPETSLTHHVIAIRGILRLIETFYSAPLDERTELCINVFDNARRDEEKRQAISVMGMLPSLKMAEKLLDIVKDENFRSEAGLAAVQLAGTMVWTNRQPAQRLAQKIRDMNISDEINIRADFVINSEGFRPRGGRRRR
jgi:HEAT repeat protein